MLERRIRVVPAVRFAWDEDFGNEVLPRVGVVVAPLPWLRLQANWEESYRVPQFDELFFPDKGFIRGNPALRPEEEPWTAASMWVHDTTGANGVPLLPAPGAATYRRIKLDYRANGTGKMRIHLVYDGAAGTAEWDDISVLAKDAMEFGFAGELASLLVLLAAIGAARTTAIRSDKRARQRVRRMGGFLSRCIRLTFILT